MVQWHLQMTRDMCQRTRSSNQGFMAAKENIAATSTAFEFANHLPCPKRRPKGEPKSGMTDGMQKPYLLSSTIRR